MNKIKSLLLTLVILASTLGFSTDVRSTTTTTDPVGNVTTEVFFGPYSFSKKVYKGSSNLLSTTENCYNGASYPCSPALVTAPVTQKDTFSTIVGISGSSQVEFTYNTYGLITDTKTYDYGPTLINEGVISYCGPVKGIQNRPCTQTTKNSGGTTVANVTFTYDGSGNTLTKNALVTGSTYLTDIFTYTPRGVMSTHTDPSGAVTTYTNSLCNGTEPNSISYPVVGPKTMAWNCNGGLPVSSTDVNGSTYAVTYNDPFWRPTSQTDALGNTRTMKYTASTYEASFAFSNSVNDGLLTLNVAGHPIVAQSRQSKASGVFDTSSQKYDNMGRINYYSLPCTSSSSTPCSSVQAAITYDTGSFPTTVVTDALGGQVTTKYQYGDISTTLSPAPSQEAIKDKQLEYDGLGRLTSVCEITSAAGSGSCGQRLPAVGYVTTYTYDAIGNVLSIVQGSQTRSYTYDALGRVLTSTQPETGVTTYTYDSTADCGGITQKGSLVEKTDNAGNTACYKYDTASRLTSVVYSGPNATDSAFYVYDSATVNGHAMANSLGRLAEAYTCTSCPGTKKTDIGLSYDILGQITDTYQSSTNSNGYYHVALTVYPNQAVNTLQLTPAVIPTITYSLDGEGRTSSILAGDAPLVESTVRGPANQIASLLYGTSDSDVFGYDSLFRMTQYAFSVGGNSVTGTLSYNANGTVAGRTTNDPFSSANNETCAYTYDRVLRLSTSNCGTVNQRFDYDRYGNITKSGSFSFAPTYSASTNRITSFTYDANGDVLTDGTNTYTWDAEGRMLSGPGVSSILYNALGQSVETTSGTTHKQFVYLPSGEKLAVMNGQSLVLARVPLPGGAQAVYTSSGLSYYAHADALGSVRLTTASNRTVSSDLAYGPFGELYNNTGVPTSVLSFTGFNQDTITGLYDSATRKYNPSQSRWVSSDRNNSPSSKDPQTLNLYSYVSNKPLDNTDLSGADDDGSDLPYAAGVDPANGETPGQRSYGNGQGLSECFGSCDSSMSYGVFSQPVIGELTDAYASLSDDLISYVPGMYLAAGIADNGTIRTGAVGFDTGIPQLGPGTALMRVEKASTGYLMRVGGILHDLSFVGEGKSYIGETSPRIGPVSRIWSITDRVLRNHGINLPTVSGGSGGPVGKVVNVYHGSADNYNNILNVGFDPQKSAWVTLDEQTAIEYSHMMGDAHWDAELNCGVICSTIPKVDFDTVIKGKQGGYNLVINGDIVLGTPKQINLFNYWIDKTYAPNFKYNK